MSRSSTTCALKVDRSCARSCASPTAECTERYSGSREPSPAGIGRPARSISAHRPTAGQRHRLAARVRAGDDQRPRLARRAGRRWPPPRVPAQHQQRVAQRAQLERSVARCELRRVRVQVRGQAGRGLGLVQLRAAASSPSQDPRRPRGPPGRRAPAAPAAPPRAPATGRSRDRCPGRSAPAARRRASARTGWRCGRCPGTSARCCASTGTT